MKVRKVKYLEKILKKKGFVLDPEIEHHRFYYLHIEGKKYPIYTYLSHSVDEYGKDLMGDIKKQLKFDSSAKLDKFFDCPMTKEMYIELLRDQNKI